MAYPMAYPMAHPMAHPMPRPWPTPGFVPTHGRAGWLCCGDISETYHMKNKVSPSFQLDASH